MLWSDRGMRSIFFSCLAVLVALAAACGKGDKPATATSAGSGSSGGAGSGSSAAPARTEHWCAYPLKGSPLPIRCWDTRGGCESETRTMDTFYEQKCIQFSPVFCFQTVADARVCLPTADDCSARIGELKPEGKTTAQSCTQVE